MIEAVRITMQLPIDKAFIVAGGQNAYRFAHQRFLLERFRDAGGELRGEGWQGAFRRWIASQPEGDVSGLSVIAPLPEPYAAFAVSAKAREPQELELPSMVRMGKNFTVAVGRHLVSGRKIVDPGELSRRLSICEGCPSFFPPSHKRAGRCAECGCFMRTKARWSTSRCVLGLW